MIAALMTTRHQQLLDPNHVTAVVTNCVPALLLCRGYPQCPDSRDVSECDEDLKCVLTPDAEYRPSNSALVSDLSGGHHYCDYDFYRNNGQYDTITREDEADLDIISRKVQINYTSISECNTADTFNQTGLMCGEQCVPDAYWCQENNAGSCGKYNFSTNNNQLCANTTFWAGKTCDTFYSNGRKAAIGMRCTGAAQHCIYPWYMSSIYSYEVRKSLLHTCIHGIFEILFSCSLSKIPV